MVPVEPGWSGGTDFRAHNLCGALPSMRDCGQRGQLMVASECGGGGRVGSDLRCGGRADHSAFSGQAADPKTSFTGDATESGDLCGVQSGFRTGSGRDRQLGAHWRVRGGSGTGGGACAYSDAATRAESRDSDDGVRGACGGVDCGYRVPARRRQGLKFPPDLSIRIADA